ncbi:type 1 glutamine amidotransferase domain-containing protein [Pseudoalteromonas luteoviolacea]|uniref:Thiazole biosynthesis protein ThiJ n=1 Tax=Pseudoalteromonas luteoviolacea H33 TaxID=1365251 RepID=A0A167F9A9_9GAMM|nr:type 1 glutamine amidotransferase domain-containing protein [Pseudoalteromonas luteoviolacea]KZN51936.1 thiazole biosynthesis protein ThiJ [Pseudoalteromonas luteoviolacea H33]KZN78652.1 thiazole biosynthesis protein ThiJ [Pseudoalteromonas luteoviolacea H33-S]MBQ4876016.1 type 1 glutamine amidotransferase domain-containing protein [Pseudoalteromonas luteoviolacea]MBQ4905651.1 type 1 glutamine amidotransferase domain-containing protein [Pseudoalteromonas luteoviolacea]
MKLKTLLALSTLTLSPIALADDILVVMSDTAQMTLKNGTEYKTGVYLNELMEPVKLFLEAGHTLTFASPKGMAPRLDPVSDTADHFLDTSKANYTAHKALFNQLMIDDKSHSPVVSFSRIEQIGIEQFDAVFVPGGHAPLGDLVANPQLGEFLKHFNSAQKPTGLVCHGPVALLSALPNAAEFETQMKQNKDAKPAQGWVYADYKMTTFSNSEETVATKYYLGGDELHYWPQDALTKAGGKYSRGEQDWYPHIVVDRELITGQNNKSSVGVAKALLKQLEQ